MDQDHSLLTSSDGGGISHRDNLIHKLGESQLDPMNGPGFNLKVYNQTRLQQLQRVARANSKQLLQEEKPPPP
jgi:hypothetical protein